jgi:hypothetical protein
LEDLGIDGRIILLQNLKEIGWELTGVTWLTIVSSVRPYELGSEPSGSIKGGEFFEHLLAF